MQNSLLKHIFWQKFDGVLLGDCRCGLVTVGGCLVTASPIPLIPPWLLEIIHLFLSICFSVAKSEPPVLRRLQSQSQEVGRSREPEPLFMAAPAPAGSVMKAKKTSFSLVICKHEVSSIYRNNIIQKLILLFSSSSSSDPMFKEEK